MMSALGALAQADEISTEQLAKQLLRHQIPLATQVESLAQMLEYQKSLIPEHLVNPLIDSVMKHVCSKLNAIRIDEEASKKKKQEAMPMMSKVQQNNPEVLEQIEEKQ